MEIWIERVTETFGTYLPRLLAAVAILVVGWLLALAVAALVRAALRRTTLDNRLAGWLQADSGKEPPQIEKLAGRIVFWVLMIGVVVGFLQVLGLAFVAGPLRAFLDEVFAFLPNLLSAGVLVLAAWLLARVLRFLVQRGARAARLDERLARQTRADDAVSAPETAADTAAAEAAKAKPTPQLSKTLGETVYWLTFLLFLPAILGALGIQGLLAPIDGLLQEMLGFVPNLLAAGLILVVGWLVARVVQRLVANLLAAAGLDRVGERLGVSRSAGGRSLSAVIGLVLYVLILIPVIIAALNALAIQAVTEPASEMLNRILLAIPNLFAAGVILLLAYYVGRVLAGLLASLLSSIGFDRFLERIGLVRSSASDPAAKAGESAEDAAKPRRRPSDLVGYLALVGLMLFATIEALSLLEFELLAAMVTEFTLFAGNVLLGALIFVVGYYLGGLAAELIRSSRVAQAELLARVAQAAVVVLASVMALRQAGLAEDVILLAFGLTLGAIAVAAAVAFGVGGREVAKRYLERWTGGGAPAAGGGSAASTPPPSVR